VYKQRKSKSNELVFIELFSSTFPSHGRGRRFNPYSAHHLATILIFQYFSL
jgi:hypothetical protein